MQRGKCNEVTTHHDDARTSASEGDETHREFVLRFGKIVDKAWEDKTADEILKAPPSALEGLTELHDEVLRALGIKTVGDLGRWKYATRAAALVALASLDKGSLDDSSSSIDYVREPGERRPGRAETRQREDASSFGEAIAGADDRQHLVLTIYTSGSAQQGRAIRDALLEVADDRVFSVESLGPEVSGSWFQRVTLRAKYYLGTSESQEAIAGIKVAIENAALNERQAIIDGHKAESVAKLAQALAPNDEAVVVLGTLVYLKTGGRVVVKSIDAVTANHIEKSKELLSDPSAVLRMLSNSVDVGEPGRELPAGGAHQVERA